MQIYQIFHQKNMLQKLQKQRILSKNGLVSTFWKQKIGLFHFLKTQLKTTKHLYIRKLKHVSKSAKNKMETR